MTRARRGKQQRSAANWKHIDVRMEDAKAVLERIKPLVAEGDYTMLERTVETLAILTQELKAKTTSLKRLRAMLFGAKTEKTSEVLSEEAENNPPGKGEDEPSSGEAPSPEAGAEAPEGEEKKARTKQSGHGRTPAAAYTGAKKVKVPHELQNGTGCPDCHKGKLYGMNEPATMCGLRACLL